MKLLVVAHIAKPLVALKTAFSFVILNIYLPSFDFNKPKETESGGGEIVNSKGELYGKDRKRRDRKIKSA